MLRALAKAYNEALFDTDRERAVEIVRKAIAEGISPEDVLFNIIVPGIDFLGELASREGNINLAQHFMAAQIAELTTQEVLTKFKYAPEIKGRVVIGTSQGDFHGLGKKIVTGCLKAHMIEVIDLGLDVTPERFVEESLAHEAQVIAISSMMVHTARGENGCLKVRQIVRERNLEGKIKIAVGGAPYRFDHDLYRTVQADGWAENGLEAAKLITELIKKVQP